MHKPKTSAQLGRMFGLAAQQAAVAGMEPKEYLEDLAGGRLSALTFDRANAIIVELGGDPIVPTTKRSRRTESYRRKKAGIPQIATAAHLKLMNDLAEKRGITADGLASLCRRMLKGASRPRTSAETNKIIEAIKSMIARDENKTAKEAA